MTTTYTTTVAELRALGASTELLAFAESIATPDGAISFELTPLTWVWLESDGRCWASWLGITRPSLADILHASGYSLRGGGA